MAASRRRHPSPVPPFELRGEARGETPLRLAGHRDVAAPSPARWRRDLLERHWPTMEVETQADGRWSQRRTLAFIGLTCGGFWACVIAGAAQLLR